MRIAVLEDSRLKAALYISKTGGLPSREWLAAQLEAEDAPSSVALLAGRPAKPAADRGPIVCVCFDIGTKTILAALASESLTSVDAVGACLRSEEPRVGEECVSKCQSSWSPSTK